MKVQLLALILLVGSSCATYLTCPDRFDPQNPTFLPHPDCTKYIVCNWQNQIVMNCPAGLHWNQQASYCDFPNLAGCLADPVVPPTTSSTPTTARPPSTTPAPPTTPSGSCPEVYDPSHQVYFPHATDCTRYYICTYEGTKLIQSCPAGLHWSVRNNYCDYPDRAQCKIATTQAGVVCPPGGNPDVPTFLPHESDCTKYYVCDNGHSRQMDCPAGLFWNAVETTCDNPEHSGCVQRLLLRLW